MKLTYVFTALFAVAYVEEQFSVLAATSAEARQKILDHHNEIRNNVEQDTGVAASNIIKMSYDTSLEVSAEAWAQKCTMGNSERTTRFRIGENVSYRYGYWSKHEPNANEFVQASTGWWTESLNYKFGDDISGHVVKQYTQQIWWNSDKLGCGASWCPQLKNPYGGDVINNDTVIVCQYKPGGNLWGEDPFTAGKPICATDGTYTNLCIW